MRLVFIGLLVLNGCERAVPSKVFPPSAPGSVEVSVIGHADGCTIYRFMDSLEYVYFVRCAGQTTTSYSTDCGKDCTEKHQVVVEQTK